MNVRKEWTMSTFVLGGKPIGPGHPPYVIAELSGNHNGSIDRAREIISAAAANGADAIKLQSYTPDTITIKSDRPEFRVTGGLWDGYTLWDLYAWAHTPFEWHAPLFEHAKACGITCISTPFDHTAVDLLEDLDAPFYKVASFEMTDLPLVRRIAQTGKPVVISTGLANEQEIRMSVEMAKEHGSGEIVLLHCISSYPAPIDQANLRAIATLTRKFDCLAGLSDHTLGNTAAIASVALGASVIEKHFTLNREDGGPDAEFSMEPKDLAALTRDVRDAWLALGSGELVRPEAEKGSAVFRRSLYVVADIEAGDRLTPDNIRSIRPGAGMSPARYDEVIGRKTARHISAGTPLTEADLE
jgi:pseudaminic acid synthase